MGHDHHNHDHHDHDIESGLSFHEKLEKLLQHWIKHNTSHADTYLEWQKKAGEKELTDIAALMGDAAELTNQINEKFEQALKSMAAG